MSEKLLNRDPLHRIKARFTRSKPVREYNWRMLVLLPVWVAAAYIASNLLVAGLLIILNWLHVPLGGLLRPAIFQTAADTMVYALTITIVIVVPYAVHRRLTTKWESLGLNRLMTWTDIGLAPVTFIVYTLVVVVALAAIKALIPTFPTDQAQDVGFNTIGSQLDNMLAFLTLVILAPIAEETLFRGYLYGKLRAYVPTVVAALATSLLFGIAHLQWNVGVDVFILSLFLCGLRSLTGSIWAGVLVHMIKNGLAYYILFVSPLIGG